jgi:hypothetical protein
MNHPLPSHEALSVELLELSPDLLGRIADGELHLYTEAIIPALQQSKTYEDFEDAIDQALIVALDPDELFSLFRLLADYYESIHDDLAKTVSVH